VARVTSPLQLAAVLMLGYESHQSFESVGAAEYLKVEPKGPATRGQPLPLAQ
jgi:hypothetical protein